MAYTDIDKSDDYFNTVTYVANQTDNRQITVGFQPDWTWLRDRDQAVNYDLYDSVRGATKSISSNNSNAEATQADGLKSFNSTGFTLGTGWGNQTTGDDYVAWNWLAGGTASSNTDGSITSQVSANTTSGFSIVSYTGNGTAGATIGHGLGTAPKVVLIKRRSIGGQWVMGHGSLGFTKFLELDLTAGEQTSTLRFNDTAPTSSVFTVGSTFDTNQSGTTIIAYCFAEKKGFSKFGSYTGNGSSDGTFIYTGFKPAFVLQKKTSGTSDWVIYDNKRDPSNVVTQELKPNSNATENSFTNIDILSNGFKQRANYAYTNNSGATYIYMAFAENPFTTSTGISTTAR